MAPSIDLVEAIRRPKMRAFRRLYIKRRVLAGGLYETDWQELTVDVKKWGSIKIRADYERPGKLTTDGLRIVVQNDNGKYNPHDNENSFWYGYSYQQRSLLKIEAGYLHATQGSDLIWRRQELPGGTWDRDLYDLAYWDSDSTLFTGIISGDIYISSKNEVTFQVKPMTQVFRDYPAANLVGLTTSLVASSFMTLLRDQTDGSGNYIFRPFFGDTTTYWDISTTTHNYSNLGTTTAKDIRDKNCLDVMEKLAEAEQFSVYIDKNGTFKFVSLTTSASVAYQFHGLGAYSSVYGNAIKEVTDFSKAYDRYYSRVQVRFGEGDTSTSFASTQASFAVTSTSIPWTLGHKTFSVENYYIPNGTVAGSIAGYIFTNVSSLKDHISFTTHFVPHPNILDRISMHYDAAGAVGSETLWDVNDWDTELTWDSSRGDAIILDGDEFKFLSIDINLDNFECKFTARAI